MAIENLQEIQTIEIGRQLENKATLLQFNLAEFTTEFGSGTAKILHKRSCDSRPYIANTTKSGNTLSWPITSADTYYAGTGYAEIQYYVGDVRAKSAVFRTNTIAALVDADSEQPGAVVYVADGSQIEANKQAIEKIKQELSITTEATRNMNSTGIALQYVNASGVITSAPQGTYLGMGGFIPCEANATYTVKFNGAKWPESEQKFVMFTGFKTSDEENPFVRSQRNLYTDKYTFTTPANACAVFIDIYNSAGILNEDGEEITADGALEKISCQIEAGREATEYIQHLSAVDLIVRKEIAGMSYAAPPEYFMENLETACSEALEKIGEVGLVNNKQDGIQFVFFSDPHWGENTKNSPALALYAKNHTAARYVICGGDALTRSGVKANMVSMANNFANAFRCVAPVEFVFGNHDRNQNNNTDTSLYLSDVEVYATMFRNVSGDAVWNGYFNYYIDDMKSNTRLVFVTQFYNDGDNWSTQEAWIRSVAEASQNMNMIYIIHSTAQGSATHLPTIKAMHDLYGNVKAVFSGHRHLDAVECYQSETEERSAMPIITIDADCRTRLKNADGTDRADAAAGTIDEQCLDIVTMHYSENTIYCSRIGRGSSRVIIDGILQE